MGETSAVIGALWGAALIYFDVRFKRLPDWLTLPAAVASLLFFESAGLIWPGVKLAFSLGMWVTHECGVMGQLLAMVGASLSTVVWGSLRKDSAPPHGPGMLIAAVLCVIVL